MWPGGTTSTQRINSWSVPSAVEFRFCSCCSARPPSCMVALWGGILLQREEPVLPDDTVMSLALRLAHIGADLVIETLHGLDSHVIKPVPQDDSRATFARLPTRGDGRLDWRRTSQEIYNRLRGFQPWIPSVTAFRGKHLTIHAATPAQHARHQQHPARSLSSSRDCSQCVEVILPWKYWTYSPKARAGSARKTLSLSMSLRSVSASEQHRRSQTRLLVKAITRNLFSIGPLSSSFLQKN